MTSFLALAATAAFLGAAQAKETAFASRTFPRSQVVSLNVQTESGAIEAAGKEGDVSVRALRPEGSKGKCELIVELKKGLLTVAARKPKSAAAAEGCDAGFSVTAPARVTLEALSGSGTVAAAGFRNGARIRTGSGSVRVDGVSGKVFVMTGSGDVNAVVPAKLLDVRTGSGNVAVALALAKAEVRVRTGSGDVSITAPQGAKALARLESGSGKIVNEVAPAKDGPLKIAASTGSGDIKVLASPR